VHRGRPEGKKPGLDGEKDEQRQSGLKVVDTAASEGALKYAAPRWLRRWGRFPLVRDRPTISRTSW